MTWKEEFGSIMKVFSLRVTYKRRPVVLKYYERFDNADKAIAWEKQLKGWSRKKKEALMQQNWELLKQLSKSKSGYQSSTGSD